MFLLTQFIGLYVVDHYANERVIDGQITKVENPLLPYGMGMPEMEENANANELLPSIILSFVFAILIFFLLTKIKAKFVLKLWFFLVIIIALGISLTSILPAWNNLPLIAALIALPFAILKTYGRNFFIHNLTELLIYPGIAAVFVPLIGLLGLIILLVLISLYDMWAVWKSGIMQKMAKFQMNELKIFSGFFIPYASKKEKEKLKKLRASKSKTKTKKIKVNVAILGGGDVIFPIIAAGVILKTWGLFPAIGIIFGALLGLGTLLLFSEKKKFYPAMPFISAGIFLALGIAWLIRVI